MNDVFKLFVCLYNGEVVNASIYTNCRGIIQAQLEGVREDHAKMSTGKLLEDTVRLWGNEIGAHTFHLGRGLGGAVDSLYYYKKGFSKREHPFYFWKHVNNVEIYKHLIEKLRVKTGIEPDNNYFPLYRHPSFLNNRSSSVDR